MTAATTCQHCGQRIVLVNFALGPQWMHQPEGAAFSDSMTAYCQMTMAAEPVPEGEIQTPCVLTDRNDMEAYAEAFNDGFELAVAQGLADDPVKADEWLAEHDERVRQTVIRDLRSGPENLRHTLDALPPSAARASEHRTCDCVPTLGPPHCHACSDAAGEPVPWSERRCER